MSLCGVIPAAGRGARLGFSKPKLLVPVTDTLTIWDVLKRKMMEVCDHIVVVMSPWGEPHLREVLAHDPDAVRISVVIQPEPIGMGDAVMRGVPVWENYDDICVIWGDQLHVSRQTLEACKAQQESMVQPRMTLPLAAMDQPYVEYRFDKAGRLLTILQSREGDACAPGGWGDIGTFFLSTKNLSSAWESYAQHAPRGRKTNEVNFLPFLIYLSQTNWNLAHIAIADADEAKGINDQNDLAYFLQLYNKP